MKINELKIQLKKLEKEPQIKPKLGRMINKENFIKKK